MSDTVPTVKIKGPDGFVVINADDFDASQHTLFGAGGAHSPVAVRADTPPVKRERPAKKSTKGLSDG